MSGPDVTAPKKPPDEHLQAVHERLVARAQARLASAPGVFVRRYQYSAAQLPGWVVKRARTVEPTARPGVLRLSQLTLAAAGDPAQLVKLDVYETLSPETARELLVELLTGYQSLPGQVELAEDIGDADLVFPGDGTRIFTRGNLVMQLVTAGAHARTVGELARSLDDFLMAAPTGAALTGATPTGGAPAGRAAATAATAAAPASSEASEGSEAMTRYMVSGGMLRQEADGSIVAQDPAERLVVSTFDARREGWQAQSETPADEPRAPRRPRPRRNKKS